MPWSAPAPWIREYIQTVREVFSNWRDGAKLEHHGERYAITLMTPEFTPVRTEWTHRPVPIHLAAVNQHMARLAGRECDGIMLHSLSSREYVVKTLLPAVAEGARLAGRPPSDVAVSASGFVATGATDEEVAAAREEVRRRISFYGSTRTYKAVLDLHGHGDLTLKLPAMSLRGEWKEMPRAVPDEVVDVFCISGTYDEIGDALRARSQGWADLVSLPLPSDPRHDDKVRLAVERIRE